MHFAVDLASIKKKVVPGCQRDEQKLWDKKEGIKQMNIGETMVTILNGSKTFFMYN